MKIPSVQLQGLESQLRGVGHFGWTNKFADNKSRKSSYTFVVPSGWMRFIKGWRKSPTSRGTTTAPHGISNYSGVMDLVRSADGTIDEEKLKPPDGFIVKQIDIF